MNQQVSNVIPLRPATDNQTVRRPNLDYRQREYLTPDEMARLLDAARSSGRYGSRNYAMILIAYRHGLRVSELIALRWSDVDWKGATIHIRRLKGSISGVHPLEGDELRALRRLDRTGEYMFTSERGAPLSPDGFRKLIDRLAPVAGLEGLRLHPHMLRHACGYALANRGVDTRTLQAYLGHSQIANTVRYTALDASRFRSLWAQ